MRRGVKRREALEGLLGRQQCRLSRELESRQQAKRAPALQECGHMF